MTSPEVLKLMIALPLGSTTSECVNPVALGAAGPLVVLVEQDVVVAPPDVLFVHIVMVVVTVCPITIMQVWVEREDVATVVQLDPGAGPAV